jgi:hypothetical protein
MQQVIPNLANLESLPTSPLGWVKIPTQTRPIYSTTLTVMQLFHNLVKQCSAGGYIFILAARLISWPGRKQPIMATSLPEAE